jgi:hypothetical protein
MHAIAGILIVGACILVAIALSRFFMSWRVASVQDRRMTSAYVADPNNKLSLSVRGWNRTELDKILADFLKSYDLPDASTMLRIEEKPGDILVVTFPRDIQPAQFFFLVNYIQYPKDFDLEQRSIGVLGHIVITPAFGPPDTALVGKNAEIYVPADDDQYDEVYARVESGAAYRISFTNLIWQPAAEARMPATVAGL